ncbi:MAG: nucleoside 2-deoxyribosyltransferase [Frankiales bacterium]|nr:nucleoside 2-deoxyribosyltransferase [Frankiales bacterium]
MTRSVYVASPLGFTLPTRAWYVETLLPQIALLATVLDPWSAAEDRFTAAFAATGTEHDRLLDEANRYAGATNEQLIRSADAVFAVLDGTDVDSGTAAEIGFAFGVGVPVVGWRSDLRTAGDNHRTVVNLQVEHFLGRPVHTDLASALQELDAVLRR